ncbi:hypothetical protein G4B88_020613 [Cannabis sativa]|uniref:Uncharacterized protein n=1 Tax=Cannabis sativa TaxID=3483 RepID=A0A7J6EMY2_CANSA|nr:hypothetical protein G4B88_020613 [Cannabis sativa]
MGFQEIIGGRHRCDRYEKLSSNSSRISLDEKVGNNTKSKFGRRKRVKGIRLSRSRKITLKVFSMVVFTSKIVRIFNEIVSRMSLDGVYPNIIFTSQWGLPVLSHHSSPNNCTKTAISFHRNLCNLINRNCGVNPARLPSFQAIWNLSA